MAELTQEEQMLEKAGAFEEMVNTNGWKYVSSYIEEQIKEFANTSILVGYKSLEDFNYVRGQIVALRQILVEVESHLTNLNNYREKQRADQ